MDGRRRAALIWASASLTALMMAGCSASPAPGGDQGREIAARFLDDLREGRVDPAWQGTSAEFKSLMGRQSLQDLVKAHPVLRAPAEYAECRPLDRGDRSMAEHVFRGTAKVKGKQVQGTIKVMLAAGDEGLKVEKIAVE